MGKGVYGFAMPGESLSSSDVGGVVPRTVDFHWSETLNEVMTGSGTHMTRGVCLGFLYRGALPPQKMGICFRKWRTIFNLCEALFL